MHYVCIMVSIQVQVMYFVFFMELEGQEPLQEDFIKTNNQKKTGK